MTRIVLNDAERATLLAPCDCGHTINDHGSLVPCWLCEEEGGECAVTFEALLVARIEAIVAERALDLGPLEELADEWEALGWTSTVYESYPEIAAELRAALGSLTGAGDEAPESAATLRGPQIGAQGAREASEGQE